MVYTTAPSVAIALILYLIIGFNQELENSAQNVSNVQDAIKNTFVITPWLFLVPAILFVIIIKKVPPLPALAAGVLLGGVFAIIYQPEIIKNLAEPNTNYAKASYMVVMEAIYGDVSIVTPDKAMNDLFSTSGMAGMLNTIWLILSAMIFGGVMQAIGMLGKITQSVINKVKSDASLIASTAFSCIFFNTTASDQYIAIVVPGKMYSEAFKKRGLKPEVLSRTLEDSGTVTSVLIPWNTGGATQARVLGVPTLEYLPFAFFNIISPIMTVIFAYLNIKIRRFKKEVIQDNQDTEI
jgi:NhaC family Na+:H+ antiporter